MRWVHAYDKNGGFFVKDRRGSYERHPWILYIAHNDDLLVELKTWIKRNLSELTVSKTQAFIASDILPKISLEEKKKYRIPDGQVPSLSQVHMLMLHEDVGCKYKPYSKSYYVDAHERPDVRAYRAEYLEAFFGHELRMYKWIQITKAEADALRVDYPNLPPGHE